MAIAPTGHAEIDHQHTILDSLVAELQTFCPAAQHTPAPACERCGACQRSQCRGMLSSTVQGLESFLVGHATYEERMMELLPDTPTCQTHIKAHKAAHQGVSRQLKKLATQVDSDNPLHASSAIWRIIGDWMGDHSSLFDHRLVRMAIAACPEINFDNELVDMLDQHVFLNRPTTVKSPSTSTVSTRKNTTEVRQRFESLTPAQATVFWRVVSGKKNREIADELGISTNTVKTHRAVIFQKMGVSSAVELIKKTDILR